MSEQMVLAVLTEVLDELKEANKSLKEMGGTIKGLETRVQAFEKKEIKIEPTDLGPIIRLVEQMPEILKEGINGLDEGLRQRVTVECAELRKETMAGLLKVATAVEAQPKPIVRRISFFPENDYQGNYKHFIRWVICGIISAMIVLTVYVLINEWILRTYPREAPAAVSGMEMSPAAEP
ncbi:MAG TPA: hypothetical protein VHW43_03190, partial [Puia sp.]|nr:hypothetical protein [Puia sp.]